MSDEDITIPGYDVTDLDITVTHQMPGPNVFGKNVQTQFYQSEINKYDFDEIFEMLGWEDVKAAVASHYRKMTNIKERDRIVKGILDMIAELYSGWETE